MSLSTGSRDGSPSTARRPGRAPRSGRESGFTLLEVLIAFAILAVSLGAVMSAFSGGLRSAGASRDHALALAHARSVLDRVGADIALVPGDAAGRTDDGFVWTVQVEPYGGPRAGDTASAPFAMARVAVRVEWDGERAVVLETLRIVPAARWRAAQ